MRHTSWSSVLVRPIFWKRIVSSLTLKMWSECRRRCIFESSWEIFTRELAGSSISKSGSCRRLLARWCIAKLTFTSSPISESLRKLMLRYFSFSIAILYLISSKSCSYFSRTRSLLTRSLDVMDTSRLLLIGASGCGFWSKALAVRSNSSSELSD